MIGLAIIEHDVQSVLKHEVLASILSLPKSQHIIIFHTVELLLKTNKLLGLFKFNLVLC